MSGLEDNGYPGASASPNEVVALANAYCAGAELLMQRRVPRIPASQAPARFCAIHAIELYLNAFLLHTGEPPEKIRGHFHNLSSSTELAIERGLVLRKRTGEHLTALTDNREYLHSRYGAEMSATLSEITRLMATLKDVARKVHSRVAGPS